MSTWLAAVVVLFGAAEAQAATAKLKGRPLTPTLSQGEKLELELTAVNSSKKKSTKAKVALLLSTDKRESKQDLPIRGKVKIPSLAGGNSKSIRMSAKLPKKAKPDGYYVLACAGKAKCRALQGTVGISPRVERVNVSLQPEGSSQVAQLVTRNGGGVLDAVAADGTRYRLVAPPGSVPADMTLTMTPLAGAQGLPFDGLAAGVKLEPAGLELDEPAKLLIQRDGLTVSPNTAGFGSSNGNDLFLTPWTSVPPGESLGDGTVALGITHFSGWGVVSLNQTQLGAQYARSAFQAHDRIAQEVREAVRDSGTGVLDEGALSKIVKDYNEQVVKPLLEAAIQDPVFFDDAVRAYIGLERQLELLGKPEGFSAADPAIASLFKRAFMRYVQVLRERCGQADFTTIAEAIGLARQMVLLAGFLPGITGPPQSLHEALELLDPCLRFELRMTSSVRYAAEFDFTATTQAVVPLHHVDLGGLVGEGPIDYLPGTVSYQDPRDDCSETFAGTTGSTMTVEGAANLLQLSAVAPGKPAVVSPQVSFTVFPGAPRERFSVQCPDEPPVEGEFGFWTTFFGDCTHADPSGASFAPIDGFQATGTPGVIATRQYSGSFPCRVASADPEIQETWELIHTPHES